MKKAAIKPRISGPILIVSDKIFPSKRSLATLPKIKGTTIKNENLAEDVLSNPKITEVAIVAPDLEIPGNIAIAWEIPIKKLCGILMTLLVGFALSAKNSRDASIVVNFDVLSNIGYLEVIGIYSGTNKENFRIGKEVKINVLLKYKDI